MAYRWLPIVLLWYVVIRMLREPRFVTRRPSVRNSNPSATPVHYKTTLPAPPKRET